VSSFLDGNEALLALGAAICAFGLALFGFSLYRDIKFYSANGWDLEKDSGVSINTGSHSAGTKSLSAKERFYFAYPFAFLVGTTGFVVISIKLLN
jgi:hypothetical protein